MRDKIRDRGEWRSAYVSDSEINAWINEASQKFYTMMAAIDPLRYIKSSVLNVVSGTSEYDIPDDFFKTVGIAIENDAQDGYHVIDSFNWDERYNVSYASTKTGTKYLIKGETQDNTRDGYQVIQLMPTPTFSANLLLDYIPVISDLDSDNDTIDTINGLGQEWIICDVAIKCATKEETDPASWIAIKQEAGQLLAASGKQDAIQTKSVSSSDSLQSIQRSIRSRGQWERELFTDTELTEYINSSISFLWDMIIAVDPTHLLSRTDITTASGTKSYDLPTGLHRVVQVAMSSGATADSYSVLDKYNWEEQYDTDSATATETRYFVRNGKIYFLPMPDAVQTVRVDYIPKATALSAPSDTFSIGNGFWVEWVILDCAIKCAAFAATDPSVYIAQKKEAEQRIVMSATVDISESKTTAESNSLRGIQRAVIGRGKWNSSQISHTQLVEFINSSIASLRDVMILNDDSYFLSIDKITLTPSVREYDVPSDFYKVKGVSVVDSQTSDGYYTLGRFDWDERYDYNDYRDKRTLRYEVRNNKLVFAPTPTTDAEVRLEYIPTHTALSAPSDTFIAGNGYWVEWVILDCCVKCCAAIKEDPSIFLSQQSTVERKISDLGDVDMGKPKHVVRTRRKRRRWWTNG